MTTLSKRDLLRSSAALAGAAVLRPFPAAANPAVAIAIGLAVASFVGGLIANANKRNVEAYLLQAVLEEIQVIQEELAAVQRALAVILTELANLPKEISDIVAKQSVRNLHAGILGEVQNFNSREMSGQTSRFALQNADEQADLLRSWLHADAGRFGRLQDYQRNIAKLTAQLPFTEYPCDPTAAMVLEFACNTEFRIMVLCNLNGDRPYGRDYMLGTSDDYKTKLLRVTHENVDDSAASLLTSSKKRRDNLLSYIAENKIGRLLQNGNTAFNCAQSHGFRIPKHANFRIVEDKRIYRSVSLVSFDPLTDPAAQGLLLRAEILSVSSDAPRVALNRIVLEPPTDQAPKYERHLRNDPGPPEAQWQGGGSMENCVADFKFVPYTIGTPIVDFEIQRLESTDRWRSWQDQYSPPDDLVAKLFDSHAQLGPDLPLAILIDDLNVEIAKIAYCETGLAAADRALESITKFQTYVRML